MENLCIFHIMHFYPTFLSSIFVHIGYSSSWILFSRRVFHFVLFFLLWCCFVIVLCNIFDQSSMCEKKGAKSIQYHISFSQENFLLHIILSTNVLKLILFFTVSCFIPIFSMFKFRYSKRCLLILRAIFSFLWCIFMQPQVEK